MFFDDKEDEDDNFVAKEPQRPDPDDPFGPMTPLPEQPDHETTHRHRRRRKTLLWSAVVLLAAIALAFWLRYVNPYADEARTAGYVTNIERRGLIFKTFEGEMISEESLTDTTRVYSRDFVFSVDNDSVARELQRYQGSGRKVMLHIRRYYGTLPWRGASTNIVTGFTPLP